MSPLTYDELREAVEAGQVFRYRYFWGHTPRPDGQLSDAVFSQWWPCRFTVDGAEYVTAEQWMMASKARLFGDGEALSKIMRTADPAACKRLGREVRGFEQARWDAAAFDLVTAGNVAKFGAAPDLRAYLLATGDDVLVEAAPRDRIWGIGLGREDERARDPRLWRGRNLLGFALVRARAILRGEVPPLAVTAG